MKKTWIGCHRPIFIGLHYEALDTPDLAESSLSVTSLGDSPMRTLISFTLEQVALVPVQNTPLEWLSLISGL